MDCWYFVRVFVTCECGSIDLAVPVLDWSCDPVGDPASPLVRTDLRHGRFYAFFSPTNYFPLKSSKGSKCQSSRCLQNNCHNRHCRFSSWVFLYLPLRLKSGTEGKKLVIPKKILLLPTSTNKSKVTFNLKNNAEQELSFYIGWHYCKLVPMESIITLDCKSVL